MSATPRPVHVEAARLAQEMLECCRSLERSQQELRGSGEDGIEDALRRHLEASSAVCRRMSRIAELLGGDRERILQLPPPARDEVLSAVRTCRRTLEGVRAAYAELEGALGEALCAIRKKLAQVQRGGRMLSTYQRGSRLVG